MALPFSDVSAFQHRPLELFMERAKADRDGVAKLHLGVSPVKLVTSPTLARAVLKSDPADIGKGEIVSKLRAVFGDSLLTNSGAAHQRTKDAIHRHLQRNALGLHLEKMVAITNGHIARMMSDRVCHSENNTALTLQLGATAIFGSDVLSDADRIALIETIHTMEPILWSEMFRILPLTPWAAKERNERLAHAWNVLTMVVDRARKHENKSGILAALEAAGLTDEEIKCELLGLLIGSHHTTAAAVGWVMYHLAEDQAIADIVAAEADEVLADLEAGDTLALRRAPLSLAFVKEVLRLYPSAHWIAREVHRNCRIENAVFKKGDIVLVSTYQLQRDPRYWDDPDVFSLDRDFANPAYMPFGVGSRACIGMALAWFELQVLTLQFSSAFRFGLRAGGEAPKPVCGITMHAPSMTFDLSLRRDLPSLQAFAA